MILDSLFRKRAHEKRPPDDEFDGYILRIELFAPRRYRAEREAYYYNYRMLEAYRGPLRALLEVLEQGKGRYHEPRFGMEVFLKLKAFYDIRDRLSEEEALGDPALKRKFRELFMYFFEAVGHWPTEISTKRGGL